MTSCPDNSKQLCHAFISFMLCFASISFSSLCDGRLMPFSCYHYLLHFVFEGFPFVPTCKPVLIQECFYTFAYDLLFTAELSNSLPFLFSVPAECYHDDTTCRCSLFLMSLVCLFVWEGLWKKRTIEDDFVLRCVTYPFDVGGLGNRVFRTYNTNDIRII